MRKLCWRQMLVALGCAATLVGCGGDNGGGPNGVKPYNRLRLQFFSAAPLPDPLIYQLWMRRSSGTALSAAGGWTSLARFNLTVPPGDDTLRMVDANGDPIPQNLIAAPAEDFAEFDSLMITVEGRSQPDQTPSPTVYLQGAIDVDIHTLSGLAFPDERIGGLDKDKSFFTFATPTDGDDNDTLSGVWFMTGQRGQGLLDLGPPPPGWIYEGWVTVRRNSVTYQLSTGRFTSPIANDLSGRFSGPVAPPAFPGEDFLVNSPSPSLTFPLVFAAGDRVAITVEPHPDPDTLAPFPIVILRSPADLIPGSVQNHAFVPLPPDSVPAAQVVFQRGE